MSGASVWCSPMGVNGCIYVAPHSLHLAGLTGPSQRDRVHFANGVSSLDCLQAFTAAIAHPRRCGFFMPPSRDLSRCQLRTAHVCRARMAKTMSAHGAGLTTTPVRSLPTVDGPHSTLELSLPRLLWQTRAHCTLPLRGMHVI